MVSRLQRLRASAMAAHVLPFAVFLLLTGLPGLLRVENPELPWYRHAPEHWVYPLQTVLVGGLLLFFRRHYRLAPWRGLGWAVVLGLAGIVLWMVPAWCHHWMVQRGMAVPPWAEWLGVQAREDGFDPAILAAWPGWQGMAVAMRMLRMVVVVPWVEEIFWRSFLMRYVTAGEGDWRKQPFGRHCWKAYWAVTAMVVLAHQPADYLAAFIWGSLMYGLAVKTRSLGACVVMHAVGNLVLGIYVLQTRQWGFW